MSDIRSGRDLVDNPIPDIKYRVEGLLRANGGRLSLTGQAKTKKSFLAMDLALRIAAGDDWLGYNTTQGKVLYLNLEISCEKFQERIQDLQYTLKYDKEVLARFQEITILDDNIALNSDIDCMQGILGECKDKGFKVDTLIIDPRARAIDGSENEETEIKMFCDNVDKLLAANPSLSIVIVTHMGKDPSKGALGHSRYTGWLDTEIKIIKGGDDYDKKIEITGRDAEQTTIKLDFAYPLHTVSEDEEFVRQTKVEEATVFIINRLEGKVMSRQRLRRKAMTEGITDYAFTTAIRKLKDNGTIKLVKAKGPGNRKLLKLTK